MYNLRFALLGLPKAARRPTNRIGSPYLPKAQHLALPPLGDSSGRTPLWELQRNPAVTVEYYDDSFSRGAAFFMEISIMGVFTSVQRILLYGVLSPDPITHSFSLLKC